MTKLLSRGQYLDWWQCECGNQPDQDGFYACDANGNKQHDEMGSPEDSWSGEHFYCARCSMIASNKTGETVKEGK